MCKADTRVQPHAEEPMELDPQIRVVCQVGGAYLFSAAHLHSTVPNTSSVTRFSIDFRTVHLDDVLEQSRGPQTSTRPAVERRWEIICVARISRILPRRHRACIVTARACESPARGVGSLRRNSGGRTKH